MSAIISASTLRLPTWALVEVRGGRASDGEDLAECVKSAVDSGAQVLLFDTLTEAEAADAIDTVVAVLGEAKAGVLLADLHGDPDAWAESAKRLARGGAGVLGGGQGTTTAHLAAAARVLRGPQTTSIRPEA
jgi:methionine synthase I (cobalamin-dependent)